MFLDKLSLALVFAKRDFKDRYVGTGLGQLWYILSPLIMILIYSVIFSDFIKVKMHISDTTYAYSIYLISGLLAWTSFSTLISRLNQSFFDKSNIIKKISVPMYVFQLSIFITESLIFCLSYLLALGFLLVIGHQITLTFFWLIPVMFLQMLFAFSLGIILSLFSPFFKDLKEAIPIFIQLWFWMTPIVYMREMIEDKYPSLLLFNPFSYYVEIYQEIFLFSKSPQISTLFIIFSISVVTFILALLLYKKMITTVKDII